MLSKLSKMVHRNKKGFTLVELMVVVVIIGILVAIAIPVYNSTQDSAKKATCQANLRTMGSAITQASAAGVTVTGITDLVPAYIAKTPVCPAGGTYTFAAAVAGVSPAQFTCSVAGHTL